MNKSFLFLILFSFTLLFSSNCKFTIHKTLDLPTKLNEKCNNVVFSFSNGFFLLDHPIEITSKGHQSIVIEGKGIKSTNLLVNNSIGAIKIIIKDRSSVVTIKNMSIYSLQGNILNALTLSQPPGGNQHRRNLIIRDIEIANYNNRSDNFFLNGINLNGTWRPLLDNIVISGFYGPQSKKEEMNMKTCFMLKEVYDPTLLNSRCWSAQTGLDMISTTEPGSEGLTIDHSKFVEVQTGIKIDQVSIEPEAFITNNHINAFQIGIEIRNKKFINLSNNLFYRHQFSDNNQYIDIKLDTVFNSIISGNIFHSTHPKSIGSRKEIFMKNSRNNLIINNLFTEPTNIIYGGKTSNKILDNYIMENN